MKIALTGATGFIGRYIAEHLAGQGHSLRCWARPSSDISGFDAISDLEWIEGELGEVDSAKKLVEGCDAVVHAALYRAGSNFAGGEGDVIEFVDKNVLGTLKLIESARSAKVNRFVAFSTCAVHDKILNDRPLDEAHPLWVKSHYGAHKAAIEKFVHSYGLGQGYPICAIRPTGVYGVNRPVEQSKWYDLVAAVVRGESVDCTGGGKEVHVADVAKAVGILLTVEGIAGEAFNCYDCYISNYEVATLAKELSGSSSQIDGEPRQPKNQIITDKIKQQGMQFGGQSLLKQTIAELVKHATC
ncbi:NAD-dependent epimerase/dehydratase family protein [Rhodopirellula sp. MGV]|uniref:NAD-dependent epimerase/dehydratase family protein n=1 Tax=Rhodopirellula sp. MGV TaxID=2023130 RepID=UPI000B95DC83|nr:NAD(P)-dependent oxidoreductase [Rhodopirellula sp. MGV]OYP32199.1 nucleoside-diphosphate sugar epimerase [Rhodopirellula sp. MGV]PNY38004.1 NAD(P)-dependent oxidoreductase [Rhodopirellula baltica]